MIESGRLISGIGSKGKLETIDQGMKN